MGRIIRGRHIFMALCLAGFSALARAGDLPSSLGLGQLEWKDLSAVQSVFGSWDGGTSNTMALGGENFNGVLTTVADGSYRVAFQKRTPAAEDFKGSLITEAKGIWGAPVSEMDYTTDPGNRRAVDYMAVWNVGNTAIRIRLQELKNKFMHLMFYTVSFQPSSAEAGSAAAGDEMTRAEMDAINAYVNSHPTDLDGYRYRAKRYSEQYDFDKAWADVEVVQAAHGDLNPDFMVELRINSRRFK